MPLLKYHGDQNGQSGDNQVHWGRVSRDGIPFRTSGPLPMLKEEEFQTLTERVADAKMELFDLSDPEQKERYRQIIDKAANQWFQILIRKHRWATKKNGTSYMLVYMEWIEPYLEAPSGLNKKLGSDIVEVENGRS